MKNKDKIIGGIILVVAVLSIGIFFKSFTSVDDKQTEVIFENEDIFEVDNSKSQTEEVVKEDNNVSEEPVNTKIVVEIKGEVNKPDVYTLDEGSRIDKLIDLAGGLTELANIDTINRASILSDGECIVISNINEENNIDEVDLNANINTSPSQGNTRSQGGLININTATLEELKTIDGIGDVKANAIIEYRETIGKFNTIEDLTNISGIGEKILENMRAKICV